MSNTLTRKDFLSLAIASACATFLTQGCDDATGTGGAGGASGSTTKGSSSGNSGSTTSGGMTTSGTTSGATSGTTTGGSTGSGATCGTDLVAEISCPHDHAMTVSAADIAAGVDKTYDIKGTATHSHLVTLTAADFATLKAGGTVFKFVPSMIQDHCVTISCGTPGDPMTSGQCDGGNAFQCP